MIMYRTMQTTREPPLVCTIIFLFFSPTNNAANIASKKWQMKSGERTLLISDDHHPCQAPDKEKEDIIDKRYECSGRNNGDGIQNELR